MRSWVRRHVRGRTILAVALAVAGVACVSVAFLYLRSLIRAKCREPLSVPSHIRQLVSDRRLAVLGMSEGPYIADLSNGQIRRPSKPVRNVVGWSASPQLEYVAVVTEHIRPSARQTGTISRSLAVLDTQQNVEVGRYAYDRNMSVASWSVDGQYCAVSASGSVILLFLVSPGGLSLLQEIHVQQMSVTRPRPRGTLYVDANKPPAILSADRIVFEGGESLYCLDRSTESVAYLHGGHAPQPCSSREVAYTCTEDLYIEDVTTQTRSTLVPSIGGYTGVWYLMSPDRQFVLRPLIGRNFCGEYWTIGLTKMRATTVDTCFGQWLYGWSSLSGNASEERVQNALAYVVRCDSGTGE